MIGLFRRESTTSGSVAGSDPCLAAQLTIDLVNSTSNNQPTASSSTRVRSNSLAAQPGHSRNDRRRSISICAVTPIDESSENSLDPLGALIQLKNSEKTIKLETSYCKNNRRRSLFELNG